MNGIQRTLSPGVAPVDTSAASSIHETEGEHGTGPVNAMTPAMVAHEVRVIADYLKTHVFAAHRQALKDIPRDASQAELDEVGLYNERATQNNRQLDLIAESRARVLQREGETLGDIADTLAKAEKLDRLAARSSSAFRAIPFAAATVLQYARPEINKGDWLPTPLKPLTPLISGALSGVMDQVGTGVMNRVTGDTQYLKAAPEKLHGAMADSLKRQAPGLLQQSVDMGGAIQSYTARNLGRTIVATALAGHPGLQAGMDTGIAAVGGLAANAAFASRMQTTENRDHQRGGAYVFGRKDTETKPLDEETEWLDAWRGMKNASYTGAALNAAKRVAGMPIDILTDGGKAVRGLVTASSLTQNGLALAGGFAGVGKLQELATKNISNPYAKTAVSQLTNAAASSAVFAGWTTAGVVTDPATRAAEDLLQNTVKNAASTSASFVGTRTAEAARATANAAVRATNTGINAAVTTGAALRAQYDNHVRRRDRDPDEDFIEMT
ncbi:type III effector [Pseudomonas sp. Pseu.R1]|uniref:type III effector n=1 Tax=Pseudomonas sp. Pseu.R1 TaxID=3379818 RepID=UPI003B92FA9A